MNIEKTLQSIRLYSKSPAILLDCLVERIFHGVGTEEYIVLDFASKSKRCRRNYLTQFDSRRMIRHLNAGTSEDKTNIGNKYMFNKFFADFVKRDWLFTGDASEEQINAFFSHHSAVLAKPIGLTKGEGIRRISSQTEIMSGGGTAEYLLEEFITQHHALSELNSDTVNTIRVYTLKDSHGSVHIPAAALRVGAPNNCVDNFHAGGTAWPLDINTGTVVAEGFSKDGSLHSYFLPGRDTFMVGFRVPNWSAVLSTVSEAAERTPLRWLGWDVAVTETGVDIVEANNGADVDLAQFLRGIKDEVNKILDGELSL